MDQFVHRRNLERYRELLARATDEGQRRQIFKLLAEEEEKDRQTSGRDLPSPQ
jgi:hypothetical protein